MCLWAAVEIGVHVPVSIRDVANEAGVSLATVSKVLNERAGSRIALRTQLRVREAAVQLGYQPNRFAQGIAFKRTNTLALLISGLQNPFFLNILEELESRLLAIDYQIIVDSAPSSSGTYSTHGKLIGWPVDGVLMWAAETQKLTDLFGAQAKKLPVVYLGYPRQDDSNWVAFDLAHGGTISAEYVLSRGYTKITFIHPWASQLSKKFAVHHAFTDVCRKAGVTVKTITPARREETRRSGLESGLMIASMPQDERPEIVVCHNDVIAIGVYHGLLRGGLRVPEDIALVGFDGIEEGQCLDKPLTTINTPTDELCERAIELLLDQLKDTGDGFPRSYTIRGHLMPGETA